jgi:protein-disulfide isomerase
MTQSTATLSNAGRRLSIGAATLFLTLTGVAWVPHAGAQPAVGEQPAAIAGDQADAILQELKGIRQLLESIDKKSTAQAPQRPPVPQTAKVSIKGSASLGSADAPVTVVEFTDYQCPYCLKFIRDTFPKLKEAFIDTGKVRWVIRDMPLGFHKNARKAAQAAHCAGEQGKFWEMRTVLFANAKKLEEGNLPGYAQVIGLDGAAFASCLASDRHLAGIDTSVQDAGTVRITGTPTFVVGKAASDQVEGNRVVGARDFKVFEEQIVKALEEQKQVKAD